MSILPEDQSTAYRYLQEADRVIDAGNPTEGSILLYKSITHALTCLAIQRGLPHATPEDLSAVASELDEERESEYLHFISFAAARALHDNVEHMERLQFLRRDFLSAVAASRGAFYWYFHMPRLPVSVRTWL